MERPIQFIRNLYVMVMHVQFVVLHLVCIFSVKNLSKYVTMSICLIIRSIKWHISICDLGQYAYDNKLASGFYAQERQF